MSIIKHLKSNREELFAYNFFFTLNCRKDLAFINIQLAPHQHALSQVQACIRVTEIINRSFNLNKCLTYLFAAIYLFLVPLEIFKPHEEHLHSSQSKESM